MGMNESRVALYTVGISIALAGFTGAVIVPLTIVEPFMWLHPLIMMMAVVVLGGLGSIKGSFFAAYILGFAEAAGGFPDSHGRFSQGFGGAFHHDIGVVNPAGRSYSASRLRKRDRHGSDSFLP